MAEEADGGAAGAPADAALLARAEALAEAMGRVPERLETEDEVARAMRFARQIEEAAKALRQARLAALAPLKDREKAVAAPYEAAEKRLKGVRTALGARLADAVRFHAAPEDRVAADDLIEDFDARTDVEPDPDPSAAAPPADPPPANPPPAAAVPVIWEVEAVERSAVGLEALRAFFSNTELRRAAERHLKENGPHAVRGVRYRRRVKL